MEPVGQEKQEKMPTALVPIADGSEEIETACITDTLVRAGVEVTVATVMPDKKLQCKMARGLNVVADAAIADVADKTFDAIACPGGMPGAEHLRDCAPLAEMLKAQAKDGRCVAAVCASPAVVLSSHGLLPAEGDVTCFPVDKFKDMVGKDRWSETRAIVNGNVIMSQGPGTSLEFALKIVEAICGAEKAAEGLAFACGRC